MRGATCEVLVRGAWCHCYVRALPLLWQGRVTDAQEAISKKTAVADPKRRDGALAKEREKEKDNAATASAALKNLRFKAEERQRKLLVRVE